MADQFDPDKFLAEESNLSDFDPDKYLAEPEEKSFLDRVGDVLGYTGRVTRTALAAPLMEEYSAKDVFEQAKHLYPENAPRPAPSLEEIQLPVMGAAPGYKGPERVSIASALFGQKQPEEFVEIEGQKIPKTTARDIGVPIAEGAFDIANIVPVGELAVGGTKLLGKGIGSGARGAKALTKGGEAVADISKAVDPDIAMRLAYEEAGRPKNLEAIKEATRRLGVEPTPGMLSRSPTLQGMESSLQQSPSLAGEAVRKKVTPVFKAVQKTAEELTQEASALTKVETGDAVKEGIISKIAERHKPIAAQFEKLRESTQFIDVPEKAKDAVARNIMNLKPVALTPNEPASKLAERYANYIKNAKTVDDIKQIRGVVGKALKDAEGTEEFVLGEIYSRLTGLEERTIKRAAIETARTSTEGLKVGREMLGELRAAKKSYKELLGSIRDVAGKAGLKRVESIDNFLDAVEKIPSEQLADKVFKVNDIEGLRLIEKEFPNEFSLLRRQKIMEIVQKSQTKGALDPKKFVQAVKDYGPEAMEKIFGVNSPQAVQDIKTVLDSMPDMIGPSGTPQGMMFLEAIMNPRFEAKEAIRLMKYKSLANPMKPIGEVVKPMQQGVRAGGRFLEGIQMPTAAQEAPVKSILQTLEQYQTEKEKKKEFEFGNQTYISPDQARDMFLNPKPVKEK